MLYTSIYFCILIFPIIFVEFDSYSVNFVFGFFLSSISVFFLLKKSDMLSPLRMFFLLLPGIFYLLNVIPISVGNRILTKDDIMAFLQTNVSEAFSYLESGLNIFIFVVLLGAWIIWLCLSVIQNANKKIFIHNTYLLFIFFLEGLLLMSLSYNNLLNRPFLEAIPQIKQYREFYDNLIKREPPKNIKRNTKNGIYVVVIGESQNKNRMSVYGYSRKTTPFLTQVSQSENWIFLDNIYSCHTHTIPTLTYVLTQKNNYNTIKLEEAYNVIDILHGFNTYWISNQQAVERFSEPITRIGLNAEQSVFINKSFVSKAPYDEELLKHLPTENELKDISVIFVHLMGNHLNYVDRYPKNFQKWNDHYDNSMLYNDYVVQKIYEYFSPMKNFMSLIYFSDHADDPIYFSHDASDFTWEMTKIPFYIYFSNEYIKEYPQKYKALADHMHMPFTNDMFFDTFLGILDIADERFYVPENDLSNIKYNHTKKTLSTLHGMKLLSDESMLDSNNNKFYLHRVNSPQKLKELGHRYTGLEMDIIYHEEENNFENSHDPQNLQLYHLEKTLKMYQEAGNKQNLWLDFKNLSDENKINAEDKLSELINKYYINKNDIWIESNNYNALEYFTQKGWKTSYYFPYYAFNEMSAEEIETVRKMTEEISYSGKVSAISFAGRYYDFIKSLNINNQISLLTWFDQYTLFDLQKEKVYSQLLKDEQLKVILVKSTGNYHR